MPSEISVISKVGQWTGATARRGLLLADNLIPSCLLHQQGNGLYVLTLVEMGFEDGMVYKIAETEQLEGTELMVVAQAEFQAEVAIVLSQGFAFLRNVFAHLVERLSQQSLHTFAIGRAVF